MNGLEAAAAEVKGGKEREGATTEITWYYYCYESKVVLGTWFWKWGEWGDECNIILSGMGMRMMIMMMPMVTSGNFHLHAWKLGVLDQRWVLLIIFIRNTWKRGSKIWERASWFLSEFGRELKGPEKNWLPLYTRLNLNWDVCTDGDGSFD